MSGGRGPGGPGGHARDARRTARRLLGLLRPEWPRLCVVSGLGVISVGFLVAGPWILGNATNILLDGIFGKMLPAGSTKAQAVAALRARGQGRIASLVSGADVVPGHGIDLGRLGAVLGLVALVYVLGAGFNWAQGYVMAGVAQRAISGLRRQVEDKLARLPLSYFDSHPHGDTLSRVTNDIDNLATSIQQGLSQLLASALTITAVAAVMFWISPVLGAVSVVIIPLAVLVTYLIARRSGKHFGAQWQHTGAVNALVEETHTGHALVAAFGRRDPMAAEFTRRNNQLRQATFRAQALSGAIQPAIAFLANINYVAIAALGGYQVATGVITLGAVQAFIQYSRQFTIPITQIASQMGMLQSGLAATERVFEFLDEPEEPLAATEGTAGPAARPAAAGRVQLQHVSFRYTPEVPLIQDFTLDVAPGQTVAIVGPTGAGKTTIVNLLMRFYEIDHGRILLDGTSYRDLTREQVRRHFGMVLQDTWLFNGTIRDNIAYSRPDATSDQIRAAARAAHADQFIATLPAGYDTALYQDAANLSAGQKQLLTIARAFLADPAILILDEATSNVDTRTETLIQDAMTRLSHGRTTFIIAHRLSTIRNADTIIVMDHGHITEHGTHNQLLNRHGTYHNLYNSQFTQPQPASVP